MYAGIFLLGLVLTAIGLFSPVHYLWPLGVLFLGLSIAGSLMDGTD